MERMTQDEPQKQPKRNYDGWIGLGVTIVVNLLMCLIPQWLFFVWLFQWAYIIPCVILAFIFKRKRIAQGMLIGGGLTLLVTTVLCGYIVTHLGSGG